MLNRFHSVCLSLIFLLLPLIQSFKLERISQTRKGYISTSPLRLSKSTSVLQATESDSSNEILATPLRTVTPTKSSEELGDLYNEYRNKYIYFEGIPFSDLFVGDVVQIHYKIPEGDKERIAIYEGIIISKNRNNHNKSFCIRRYVDGIGLEQGFTYNSPKMVKIIKKQHYKVRKAKLYYLRNAISQSMKIK